MFRVHAALSILLMMTSAARAQSQTPQVTAVLNAASYAAGGALAPGVIFSVFGTSLTDGTTVSASSIPLPTKLAGATVLVNGFAAPLYFASPLQINAQFPVELAGQGSATIQVQVQTSGGTGVSLVFAAQIASSSPGVFTLDQNGSGPGVIFHAADFTRVCPSGRTDCSVSVAAPNETISLYATGLGQVSGSWASGQVPPTAIPTVVTPTVTIGGVPAKVLFAGLTTNFVGVYQINVLIPATAPGGDSVPLLLAVGGAAANPTTVGIQGAQGAALPDLTVSLAGNPDPVASGGSIVYTATVQNIGNASAENVVLTDSLPTGVSLVSCSAPQGQCASAGGTVTASIGTLLPSASATVTLNTTAPTVTTSTSVTNIVRVSTPSGESSTANNQASKTITVTAPALSLRGGGPSGGSVGSLVIDPRSPATLYAASPEGGVYKSTNGGASWAPSNTGLLSTEVAALAIDPSNTANVYAGISAGFVVKSSDGAATWTDCSPDGVDRAPAWPRAIVLDPKKPGTIYAGGNVYSGANGVWKSSDGCATWTPAGIGLPSPSDGANVIEFLAIDPSNSSIMYAAGALSNSYYIYKTTNGGASWASLSSGIPAGTTVTSLVVDPSNSANIYVGVLSTPSSGVLKSTNGGVSWTSVSTGLQSSWIFALAIAPSSPTTLYAGPVAGTGTATSSPGAYVTTNGGASWSAGGGLSFPNGRVTCLTVDPSNSAVVYAGTGGGGIFKSTNSGATWAPANSGFGTTSVGTFLVDPANSNNLYALTFGGGVSRSTNAGASWATANAGLTDLRFNDLGLYQTALAIDPSSPLTLYVTAGYPLYKTVNGGATWAAINYLGIDGPLGIDSVVVDPSNSSTLYAGFNGGPVGVAKSTDGGVHWSPANTGFTLQSATILAISQPSPSILYAGGQSSAGLFRSTNSGSNWTSAGLLNQTINAIAADPTSPTIAYAGTNQGLFKTTNGGVSWTLLSNRPFSPTVNCIAIDPQNSNRIYVSDAFGGGIFRSSDGGTTWLRTSVTGAFSLAVDPKTPNFVYAGSRGAGVLKSTDFGQTWQPTGAN